MAVGEERKLGDWVVAHDCSVAAKSLVSSSMCRSSSAARIAATEL
jgi:hypothetical protein